MVEAKLIYDCPERNMDLFYATRFLAPDPFIFFEIRGKKYAVMSDLEFGRACKQATVHRVLSLSEYNKKADKDSKSVSTVDIIHEVLREHNVRHLSVPFGTSFVLVDGLRKKGYRVSLGTTPFYIERNVKSEEEKNCMLKAQRVTFQAIALARDLLKGSRIKGNRLIYRGKALTSESMRSMIAVFLLERGYIAPDPIVACGMHSINPHEIGSGPLMPHKTIVVDIFPKSLKNGYFGDATRTFCKGCASDALKKMYATVKEGQELGLKSVRAGINGRKIHEAIHALFRSKGYITGEKNGRPQGFITGTGHSLGLEIHEDPLRIRFADYILKAGNVMSVEPGLYYEGIGGVRIEDLVYVTKGGCEILSGFPKQLEV